MSLDQLPTLRAWLPILITLCAHTLGDECRSTGYHTCVATNFGHLVRGWRALKSAPGR